MRKRIKARVREPKRVSNDIAEEVLRCGKHLTELKTAYTSGSFICIRTHRYKRRIYYTEEICSVYFPTEIKECIEL
jgi:hypothetical protein